LESAEDLLTSKFQMRYSSGGAEKDPDMVSVAPSIIRKEVEKFGKLQNLTEANLSRLERRIQSRAAGTLQGDDVRSISGISMYSGMSMRSRSSTALAGSTMIKKHPLEGLPPMDWTKMDEYASYVHEQDVIRQQLGIKAVQKKMRSDLQEQVNAKIDKKKIIEEEDMKHHNNSLMELQRWEQMEKVREAEKKDKVVKEKIARDEQTNYNREVRKQIQDQKQHEEAKLITKIVEEMQEEQEKQEVAKEEAKKAMMKVYHANQEDLKNKAVALQEQRKRDADALVEYAKAQDAEEKRRAAELQGRMDKQQELMGKLMDSVQTIKQSAGSEDYKRALLQQEEMDHHYQKAEDTKQNRLKQMRLENQQYLLRQIEEKAGRGEDDKYLQEIQCMIQERDTQEYEDAERRKTIETRVRNHHHRKDLEKQMEYKLAQSVPLMTEGEMLMNKPLLHLVHNTLSNKAPPMPTRKTGEEEDEDEN
jgi:hypothetical protein